MRKGASVTSLKTKKQSGYTEEQRTEMQRKYEARKEALEGTIDALRKAGYGIEVDSVFAGVHSVVAEAPNGCRVALTIEC